MNAKDLGLPEGIVIIDMNSPTFQEDLEAALDFPLDENVEVLTPQFNRVDGLTVNLKLMPQSLLEWTQLDEKSEAQLKAAGCDIWEKDVSGHTHWLFPKDWYPHIPAGMPVCCIDGSTEHFIPGVTDDDYRFGCLSYGILVQNKTAPE
jgi:hypothetical protein